MESFPICGKDSFCIIFIVWQKRVEDIVLIYYHLSRYISHRNSGLDYIACLRSLGHEVTLDDRDSKRADIAILHDEPPYYIELFSRFPHLREMRTAAFCVWENTILPQSYIDPLRLVKDVWTPSRFSLASIQPHFPHARLLPHVVRRIVPSPDDITSMRAAIQPVQGDICLFFSIVDAANPRKNITGLLSAFARVRQKLGDGVRLVLKQYRCSLDFSSLPGIVSITEELTAEKIAALYSLCDAYVSAHNAEGWGLGLSQAMAYGKPVIATAYSGNMDYMDENNSFPVPYTLVPVSEDMLRRVPVFSPDMEWAAVDVDAFAERMLRVAKGRVPEGMRDRAADICNRFGPKRIASVLHDLLTVG